MTKPRRPKYLYAVCMKGNGKFCNRVYTRDITGVSVMLPAVYKSRKRADDDCPIYGEVVMFKEVK